jgi:hypothetical protein
MVNTAPINIKDFGAVGDGVADDTTAIQAAFDAINATQRSVYFPPGEYRITDTLVAPVGAYSIEFFGGSGYDGVAGQINGSLKTYLTWDGATSATTPVVQFDHTQGAVWRGISINCDYKAGYGIQLMTSVTTPGCAKNIIENCSIHYALADGILVGPEGDPASPGVRQFFGNVFRNLTMYGCARSGIHINEWNADQQMFDTVMVYLDDAAVPQDTLNAFWFDLGGQQSILINCQSGGMTVVPGETGSGYAIKNKAKDTSAFSTTGGAFGLTIIDFWQEGLGGLYYGTTSTSEGKGYAFINCNSFTGDTANPSVYIDKGTSTQIPYSFIACNFLSNIEIASSTFSGQYLNLTNCNFASTFGVLNYNNLLTTNGRYLAGTVAITAITIPAYANFVQVTLGVNVNTVFAENLYMNSEMTVIVTQDATGGRTLTWGGGQFINLPVIPAPNSAPGTKTVYTFIGDGTYFYLKSAQL